MGAERDPFRRMDPEYEAQEPADDGDHEEAHNPQNRSGHGAGPRDARIGYPPTRQEVLQRETWQSHRRGNTEDHPAGRGLCPRTQTPTGRSPGSRGRRYR